MNKISKQKKQEAKAYTITFGIIKIANGTLVWFQTFPSVSCSFGSLIGI